MINLSNPQRMIIGFLCFAVDGALLIGLWQSTLPFGIFTTIACGFMFFVLGFLSWFGK